MPEAKVVYVQIETNKHNEEQTQLCIGFELPGREKAVFQRYVIAGGTDGQQKFASMQLSKLLKLAGPLPVTVETNDRGYEDVYADDGFRKQAQSAPATDEGFVF